MINKKKKKKLRETKATLGHFSSKLQQWLRIASELKITRSDSVKLLRATHATFIARRWKRSSNTCKLFPLTQRTLLSMVSKDNADEYVQRPTLHHTRTHAHTHAHAHAMITTTTTMITTAIITISNNKKMTMTMIIIITTVMMTISNDE